MDQDAPQIGVVVGGKFRITRVLGKGGMGVVVAARNLITGKQVAIKWMHASAAAHHDAVHRLIQEAAASARVRHPNVVDVYDVIHDDQGVFLVMEYLNGEPLTRMLERGGMPVSELIAVLIGAMRGVAAAHKAGVIHRDVKPDNIFLIRGADSQTCITKVLDFGISKITDNRGPSLTQTGTALGTPMYMSCEQLRNARDVDGRADIYSFGVILYEAVTGQSPFPGDGFAEVVAKIMTTDPATPKSLSENLPDRLDEVIRQAMAKNRDDRFATMDDFIRELEPFATEPKFQLLINEVEDDPAPPVDPSMVTALTPAARNVIAHANTIGHAGPFGGPTPSSAFRTGIPRRDHSGMVPLDLTPAPGSALPNWTSNLDDDSIRPAHRTLDPRVTGGFERPRHMGVIGLLVAGATLVGLVALFWPVMEDGAMEDPAQVSAPMPGLPSADQPSQIDAANMPGAAVPSTASGNGPEPSHLSVSGEVAATGATNTDSAASNEGNGEEAGEPKQDGARASRRTQRSRRERREPGASDTASVGSGPVGSSAAHNSQGAFRELPPAPQPPSEHNDQGEQGESDAYAGGDAYTGETGVAPADTDAPAADTVEDTADAAHDEPSKWRAGELRRDEF